MNTSASAHTVDSAKKYFEELDSGRLPAELFAPDFEFYFPKFGVGRGLKEFGEFATALMATGHKAVHHRDQLTYIASGSNVVVEGTTFGTDGEGNAWDGGVTPGGRFCSVFDFTPDGLIERMFIYLDPDYTSRDVDRFHWKRAEAHW